MKKSYRSKIAAAVHETMADMHEAGLISKATMRGFDASCLNDVGADPTSGPCASANGSAVGKRRVDRR